MALSGKKVQRGGWQLQAERLALTHTAPAATALAAEQARHRIASIPMSCDFRIDGAEFQHKLEARITDLAHEFDSSRANLAEREQQVARGTAATWLLNGRRETLAARAARVLTAEKRVTELQDELALARELLALRENENQSLQMSLHLTTGENSHNSTRLAECERQIRVLEQLHSKLIDDTLTLLKTCKRRDAALARAEERLSLLADLFVQLEATNQPNRQEKTDQLNFWLRSGLENDKWLFAETATFTKKTV